MDLYFAICDDHMPSELAGGWQTHENKGRAISKLAISMIYVRM